MRQWVTAQLSAEGANPLVLVDPDGIATNDEIEAAVGIAEVYRARDWFELRRTWEARGRNRDHASHRLVIVVEDPLVSSHTDLPYDIEMSSAVRRARVPGPAILHAAVRGLDDETSEQVIVRLTAGALDPFDALLTAAADLPELAVTTTGERQFLVALRLAVRPQAAALLDLARNVMDDPLAQAVLTSPAELGDIQTAWEDWVADPAGSRWAKHMQECRAEIIDLFVSARLEPVPSANAEIPKWAMVGIAGESPADRVAALLDAAPPPAISLDDWVRVAQWWGEVRSCLAQVNPANRDLEAAAWAWWAEADDRFLTWLRGNYGAQLTRTWANWPASLDKIQPFLAKRQSTAQKILLVVLDGMGFTQWTRIRELLALRVVQSGGALAMLPTLTEVSRQAIAAGTVPTDFADSLRSTSKEPKRWAAAWQENDVTAAWVRIDGASIEELDDVPLGAVDVIGLVLSATDELMHSAELLGDLGLHAGLDAWLGSGVLSTLLRSAADHGYETWLTADHGNLAVEPTKEPREGAFVERAGTRARRYASKALRDDAAVEGVIWDELPGYPADESERLLFAPGRTGWGPSRLSHGGLSLDEVIVPLVQIEPVS